MRNISAVTFDLWDTLIKEVPGGTDKVATIRVEGIVAALERAGAPFRIEDVRRAYENSGMFLQLTWSKRRDLPVREHVLFMLNCLDSKLASRLKGQDIEELERVYSEGLLKNPPRMLPGAKEALVTVRSEGYPMGLISNTGRTPGSVLRVIMKDLDILDCFDVLSFSNEVMVRKPAESIFRKTLDDLRVPPKAAVHVGDNPEHDVEGARRVGMRAIHIIAEGSKPANAADAHTASIERVLELIEGL